MIRKQLGILAILVLTVIFAISTCAAHAQSETVLYNFPYPVRGFYDSPILTADGGGNLYGVAEGYNGGPNGGGAAFELSPNPNGDWNYTVIHDFCGQPPYCPDGLGPIDSVVFDNAGNLYGTTCCGGAFTLGTVYELSPVGGGWTQTVLTSLNGGASFPLTGLIMDSAGNLWGTSWEGTSVYEVSPSGAGWTVQDIYNEDGNDNPYAGLTVDAGGNVYGVTSTTVFRLSPDGNGGWTHTVLHTFVGGPKDGASPRGTPVLDKAGNLYGTTEIGGAKNLGTVWRLGLGKKGKWTEKVLYSFRGGKDGNDPIAGLSLDAAGNLYGTTFLGGGKLNVGTVFELVAPVVKRAYKEKVLWRFNGTTGSWPAGPLTRDSEGNLYGIAVSGGSSGNGVVFEVTP